MTPVEDVRAWLEANGFGRFADLFEDNEIDGEVLVELTDDDLAKLGLPLGARKKLLKAIASLDETTKPSPTGSPPEPAPHEMAGPRSEAERRQLTVLFCDLVGSTALSGELDPEDMSALIRTYQNAVAGEILRFEGHVAKFMGDGVLAYFGWPQAHEDDAERAVRAGLALVQVVSGLAAAGRPLAARVGIAAGLVVVGELVGEDEAQERAVVGETPNLAARLQALAAPGSVVISQATRRLVGGLFELADLGPTRLKGFALPLAAFRVEGEGRADGRFEALHGQRLTPLIGREHELAMLLERWSRAKDGDGQVVLIAGDAGIGKSRLLRALREELSGEPHVALRHFCSPYHTNSALHPVITQLERAAGFASDDQAAGRLAKLVALLGRGTEQLDEAVPLIGALLGVPIDGRYPAPNLSPQRQKQRTLEVLIEQLAGLARDRPVLEQYEDVHWVDPSTLDFLDLLVERVRALPVLVVLTYRSEFSPPWTGQSHVTALTMNRLGRRQGAAMVDRVTGGKALPDEILDQILAKTDGVPLFVEELTRTVLESGLLTDAGDHYELAGSLSPLAIPATLHDSLMARLDRLAPVKEVAQLAATLGRTFSFELLAAVSSMDGRALEDALLQLEAAELVYRRGVAPDITYDFKHALVQDVAYQSLLKGRRQQQHARIAEVLVEQFPVVADNEPEVVAHHYTAAGLAGPAADQWLKAGRRAMQRSANVEAERHLKKGLDVLQALPEEPERRRREIALQNTLGVCLMPTRGFGSRDVAEAFSRAASISEQEGDARGLFVALRGKGQYQMISGDLRTAREQASRILGLAEQLDDPGVVIEAHHLGWSALTFTGDFGAARQHAETVIALYDRDRDHGLTYVYSGHDPGVCSRSFGALALWQLGYPDEALAKCRDGERLARDVAHPFSVTIALWALGMLHLLRRETNATFETGEAMIAHCREKGFPPFIPMGRIFRGGALAEKGELTTGIAELAEGIAGVRASGTQYTLPLFFAWLAELCGKGGRLEEGLAALEQGRAMSEETEDRFSLPEFDRLEGEILLARSAHNQAEAQACFERSMRRARAGDAKCLELRAATSLARLWADAGRRTEAHDLLAPLYGWFTEGFETADLEDAKALLDQLG